MENFNKLTIILLMAIIINANIFAQQQIPNQQSGNDNCKCKELNVDVNFVKKQFEIPLQMWQNDKDTLRNLVKAQFIKTYIPKWSEYNAVTQLALMYHSDEFVKLQFEKNVFPTTKKQRKKGKPNWQFFAEDGQINIVYAECLAKKVDGFMRPQTVVIYHPGYAKDNYDLYEQARNRLQSAYVNFKYKRVAIQNLDIMPKCPGLENPDESTNYYLELLNCLKAEKRVNAQIAIVLRDMRKMGECVEAAGMKKVEYELHTQIFNANTNSFILDEYKKGFGMGRDCQDAELNAITNIISANIDAYHKQEIGMYYTYIQDGRDFYLDLDTATFKNLNDIVKIKKLLNLSGCIEVLEENDFDWGKQLKCKTWITSQADLIDRIRDVIGKEVLLPFRVKGEIIESKK